MALSLHHKEQHLSLSCVNRLELYELFIRPLADQLFQGEGVQVGEKGDHRGEGRGGRTGGGGGGIL